VIRLHRRRAAPLATTTSPGTSVRFVPLQGQGLASHAQGRLRHVSRRAATVLGVFIGAFVAQGGVALWDTVQAIRNPPSLPTQLNNIISASAKEGYRLVGPVHLVQFRAAGEPSRVLLLRPIDASEDKSDRLVIYDIKGSGKDTQFVRHLLFEPEPTRRPEPALASGPPTAPRAFTIRLRLIKNVDGQPGNEMIADLAEYAVKPIWPRPIYVVWDPASRRFLVRGLISPATTRHSTMSAVITQKFASANDVYTRALMNYVYLHPATIVDASGESRPLVAYAVEAYVIKEETLHDPRGLTAGGLALTAGYIVKASGFGTATKLQALTWHIDLRYDPPLARASFRRPTIIDVGTNWSRLTSLLVRSRT
jgi:hypothetical protein